MRSAPWTSIKELFLLPNFDNSSPSLTRDKETCQVMWWWGNGVTTSWCEVPSGTYWMKFTCSPNLLFLVFSWRYIGFQTGHFADSEQFKIDSNFLLWASQNGSYLFIFTYLEQFGYFSDFGHKVRLKKNNANPLWQKTQELHIGSGTSHCQWFNQWESRIGLPS